MQVEDLSDFKSAIDKYGSEKFWELFCSAYLSKARPDLKLPTGELNINIEKDVFAFDNLGELYEIGLEHCNKISKKELGQYYTPKDVCDFMSKKFLELIDYTTDTIADVCCGTGNLIISVLSMMDRKNVMDLISKKRIYLFDLDKDAMNIAIMKIAILFTEKNSQDSYNTIVESIKTICGNFMSQDTNLPKECIVISNPPYGRLSPGLVAWEKCTTTSTSDMYSVFMDKMATQAKGAVIISPQSFLGGGKFRPLREVLSQYGGVVYSFDNVPCNIFKGRKKGIFNTNTANSVRAAITIIDKKEKGFRISPMIRFKTEERKEMFKNIDRIIGNIHYDSSDVWTKVPKTLEQLVVKYKGSKLKVSDLIETLPLAQKQEYKIIVPSTPRYFVSGVHRNLDRSSKIEIYAKDEKSFYQLYSIINSTFSYLWWRIYDGGITYGKSTLLDLPVPDDLTEESVKEIVDEGIKTESDYVTNKMNAGKNNENVKFPKEYRKRINSVLLNCMGFSGLEEELYSIHSNSLLEVLPLWCES